MEKTPIQILLGLLVMASARANTPLTVGVVSYGVGGPCRDEKLSEKDSVTQTLKQPNQALEKRLENLKHVVESLAERN